MPTVTYKGPLGALMHRNNPSGTEYVFQQGVPEKVSKEDALFYAEEAERGGPWEVKGLPKPKAKSRKGKSKKSKKK